MESQLLPSQKHHQQQQQQFVSTAAGTGGSQSSSSATSTNRVGNPVSLGEQFAKFFPQSGAGAPAFPESPAPPVPSGGGSSSSSLLGGDNTLSSSFSPRVWSNGKARRIDGCSSVAPPGGGTTSGGMGIAGNSTGGSALNSTSKLTEELEDFVERGLEGALAAERGDKDAPSEEAIAEMQLQTARKLRQLLPAANQRDLLPMLQETQNWVSLLLGWLSNSHDRPAVQIEALLALTNIAGLSPHSPPPPAASTAPPPMSTLAAPAAIPRHLPPPQPSCTSASCAASGIACGGAGLHGVPTVEGHDSHSIAFDGGAPLPSSSSSSATCAATAAACVAAAGSAVSAGAANQAWLNNLTAAASCATGGDITSTYNILLHHPSAIPTLVSLLLSPHREVHEQAMWILGSIVVASGHGNSGAYLGSAAGDDPRIVTSATAPHEFYGGAAAGAAGGGAGVGLGVGVGGVPGGSTAAATTNVAAAAAASAAAASTSHGATGTAGAAAASAARELVLAAGIVGPLCKCLNNNAWNVPLQRIGSWLLSNLVLPTAAPDKGASKGGGSGSGNDASGSGGAVVDGGVGGTGKSGKGDSLDRDGGSSGGSGAGSSGGRSSSSSSWQHDEIDMKKILPTLRRMLYMSDADVLSHACWALSHLCDGPSSRIAEVVAGDRKKGSGYIPSRLVDLLLHPSWRVTKPALRTIGNVVCAECTDDSCAAGGCSSSSGGLPPPPPDYTEIVLQCGAVPHLRQLISHSNREIQKEACWTLSNIAAGTVDQIQAVIDSGAIPPLVRLASDSNTDHEVRSEACWVVLNATSCGSDPQVEVLISDGCVSVLGVLLGEASMVMMALEGLERVLQVEEGREKARQRAAAAASSCSSANLGGGRGGGKDKDASSAMVANGPHDVCNANAVSTSFVSASLMETLEQHKNTAIAKRASRIWKQHFVSCALCRNYFSKHRPSEAHFCNECKCHVCSSCNCEVYHLSYQEELWAADEEEKPPPTKSKAKKSKKQKKKEKRKQQAHKKATAANAVEEAVIDADNGNSMDTESNVTGVSAKGRAGSGGGVSRGGAGSGSASGVGASGNGGGRGGGGNGDGSASGSNKPVSRIPAAAEEESTGRSLSASSTESGSVGPMHEGKQSKGAAPSGKNKPQRNQKKSTGDNAPSLCSSSGTYLKRPDVEDDKKGRKGGVGSDEVGSELEREGAEGEGSPVDLVLYLQQTGSIIALAKLMDALECDNQEEINDSFLPSKGIKL